MREIKFRAWVEGANVMETWKSMSNTDLTGFLKGEYSNVKAMQYTGLKDKNGVEIYEGDVIKTEGGNVQVIEYINEVVDGDMRAFGFFAWDAGLNTWMVIDTLDYVIGNRYENPELLKEEPTC